jgi:hypothetical protein
MANDYSSYPFLNGWGVFTFYDKSVKPKHEKIKKAKEYIRKDNLPLVRVGYAFFIISDDVPTVLINCPFQHPILARSSVLAETP